MRIDIELPGEVDTALSRLESRGYEAYIVGGAVRDCLLGIKPHDFDIATSASPVEVADVFRDYKLVIAGLKHGTIAPVIDGVAVEITSFRSDGTYRDHRHPERVSFGATIADDSARRDFTINCIYCSRSGIINDPRGGLRDLDRKVVRAIGDPESRFREDALRIPRGIYLAAKLGFSIDERTAQAMIDTAPLLKLIAEERNEDILMRLLSLECSLGYVKRFSPVFRNILPAYLEESWSRLPDEGSSYPDVNLAALFLGYSQDRATLDEQLRSIRLSKTHIQDVERLLQIPSYYTIESLDDKLMYRRMLMDTYGVAPERCVEFIALRERYEGNKDASPEKALDALANDPDIRDCTASISGLAIGGDNLVSIGYKPGKGISTTLKDLLVEVNQMRVAQDRDAQIQWARARRKQLKAKK